MVNLTRSLRDLVAKYSATRPLPSYYRNFLAMKKKKGEGVEKKGGGDWGPPINPKKTIKPLKFMNEITLKMNGRNPKKADYQGASYHGRTDRRTDGRTNERTSYFFFAFPYNKATRASWQKFCSVTRSV